MPRVTVANPRSMCRIFKCISLRILGDKAGGSLGCRGYNSQVKDRLHVWTQTVGVLEVQLAKEPRMGTLNIFNQKNLISLNSRQGELQPLSNKKSFSVSTSCRMPVLGCSRQFVLQTLWHAIPTPRIRSDMV